MPATAQRIAFLRGHQDAVLCLAATSDSQLLASGSEDGGVCLHHLPSSALLCRLQCCPADSEDTAIGAVAWHPKELPADAFAHLLTGNSSGSSCRLLFAGAGRELLVLVLLLAPPADRCPDSLDSANHQALPPTAAAAAAADTDQPHAPGNQGILPPAAAAAAADGVDVPLAQLHVLLRGAVSQDDISSLSVNAAGTYLAAADDTGDVQLFDLQQLQKQLQELHALPQQKQQQQQSLLQPCRTIAGAHDPMATAVGFRGCHKPWQLLSGGVDSRVALWDFSRPNKCCSSWNMQHMNGVSPSIKQCAGLTGDSRSSSSNGVREVGRQQQQGQLWNPPMVHSLAVPWVLPEPPATAAAAAGGGGVGGTLSSNGTVSVPAAAAAAAAMVPSVPAAVAKHLVAVARGDGVVAVLDANPDAKPASKPDKQQSSTAGLDAGARTPTGQQRPGSSSSSSSRTGKGGGTGKGGRGAASPQQQQAHAASTASDANKQQAQQTVSLQQQLSEVPPGFHLCLGASLGGHTLPAAAAVFLPWGGGARFLLSGGQDGRLLLWDWPAAFGAAAAAAGAAVAASDGDPVSAAGAGAGVPGGEHDSRGKETATPVAAAAAAAAGERSRHGCLLLEKEHKRKVNALCCCWAPPVAGAAAAAVLLLVADTAPRISVYRVKL